MVGVRPLENHEATSDDEDGAVARRPLPAASGRGVAKRPPWGCVGVP